MVSRRQRDAERMQIYGFFRFARANNIIMYGRVLACARVNGTPQDM